MKKTEKWLFLPALLVLGVLLLGVGIFALVRALVLPEGEKLQVLWEILPALIVLTACAAAILFLRIRTDREVRKFNAPLSEIAQRVAKKEHTAAVSLRGCFGTLGDTLAESEKALGKVVRDAASEADALAKEREMRAAALKICRAATPETVSFGGLRYGVCAQNVYSERVGANFTETFLTDKRKIFLAVGDVWGNGLDAALFSSRLKSALREEIARGSTPAEALSAVNRTLCGGNEAGFAATVFCAVFNCDSGELRYSNAGHYPPLLAGETIGFLRIRAGAPLGVYSDAQFSDETFALTPGQGLFLYTDGAVNAKGEGERFGYDRLLAVVKALFGSALDADGVTEGIVAALREFSGEETDVSAVTLFFPGGAQQILRPVLSETDTLNAFLSEWLGDDPRKNAILPICDEIFAGIVNHAGAKAVRIGCEREDSRLTVRFTDDGEPFNPLQNEEGDLYAEGGAGMRVRRMGGEIFYRTKQELNVLTVRFPAK